MMPDIDLELRLISGVDALYVTRPQKERYSAAEDGKANGENMGGVGLANPCIHGSPCGRMARAGVNQDDKEGLKQFCLLWGRQFPVKNEKENIYKTPLLGEL